MGYSFIIGEHTTYVEDGTTFDYAEEVKLNNAPAFDEPTDYTNKRWPSYTDWEEFTKATRLGHLLGMHSKLIPAHPGCAKILPEYLKIIDLRLAQKDKYDINHQNRLTWLRFWFDWALKNCKNPVFINR